MSVSGANSDSVSCQSPAGAAAPALRDSFDDEVIEPIVPIKVAHAEARQSRRPDEQVGEADVEQAQPLSGLAHQPDDGVHHEVPQQGDAQEDNPPEINVQSPVENEMMEGQEVEAQAGPLVQQQVVGQRQVPQPMEADNQTSVGRRTSNARGRRTSGGAGPRRGDRAANI